MDVFKSSEARSRIQKLACARPGVISDRHSPQQTCCWKREDDESLFTGLVYAKHESAGPASWKLQPVGKRSLPLESMGEEGEGPETQDTGILCNFPVTTCLSPVRANLNISL